MEKNKKDKERKKKRFSKAKYGDFIRRFYRLMPTAELAELLGVEPRQVSDFAYRNNCDGCLGKAVFDITFTFSPVMLSNGGYVSCEAVYDETATGIRSLTTEKQASDAIYNLQGVRLDNLQKGLNIIKSKNGSTQKVYVK